MLMKYIFIYQTQSATEVGTIKITLYALQEEKNQFLSASCLVNKET